MKYIRTKDKILIAPNLYDNGGMVLCSDPPRYETRNAKNEWGCVDISEVLKTADTIEELCDEFDWKWNEKEFPYSTARQHSRYDGYGDLKRAMRAEENYGKYLNQDYEIYGGIWTEWGLKYVAKMNEKGELELL